MTIMDRQSELLPAARIEAANVLLTRVCDQLDRILLGRSDLHRQVMIGILSRGHILLEGLPGLGKTALVKALGDILQLDFKRIQFTPDLMPGDILGTHILQQRQDGEREMAFTPGPVFTNLLLADEINRASPKTQSAMLETMQEHRVTLLGTTRPLPDPFFVLASQNPIELEGTYPLPEAQLDRFLFKLVVRDIDADVLAAIITSRRHGTPPPPTVRLSAAELQTLFATVDAILLPAAVARYIGRLVAATHPQADDARPVVRDYVNYGASALFGGRPTVGFDDVKLVAPAVLNHRLILNYKARFDGVDTFRVIDELLTVVDAAGMDLPSSVSVTGVPPT